MEIISTLSGKGGVGKTFITTNVSIILSSAGYRVLAIDADTRMANLEIAMGLEPQKTLQHYIVGDATLDEIVVEGPAGVKVCPAGVSLKRVILPREFDRALSDILQAYDFDYVLVDCPPGLDSQVMTCLNLSTKYMLVANAEVTSLADAVKIRQVADRNGIPQLGVVVNRLQKSTVTKATIEQTLGKIISVIPFDKRVEDTINMRRPFILTDIKSPVRRGLFEVASAIAGVNLVEESNRLEKFRKLLPLRKGGEE